MALWGKTDDLAGKPKYLSDDLRNDQTTSDLDSTYGVNVAEAQTTTNRAKGIKTPGWVKTVTYTDAQGNTRNKSEVLVAFGGDFSGSDASDDSVIPDATITIVTQPANAQGIQNTAAAQFEVVASVVPSTATLTYQWQKQEGGSGAWSNVSGATSATYSTGTSITVAADNGDKYRVVVSSTGAPSVTSSAATLSVTLP